MYPKGLILLSLQCHEDVLDCFNDVLRIREKTKGDDHTTVGDVLNITGFSEAKCGNGDKAFELLSKALQIREKNEEYAKAADTLQQIGDIFRSGQQFELAIQCYKECLRISCLELGDDNESIADGYIALGNIQSVVGKHQDACASYQEGKVDNCLFFHFNHLAFILAA